MFMMVAEFQWNDENDALREKKKTISGKFNSFSSYICIKLESTVGILQDVTLSQPSTSTKHKPLKGQEVVKIFADILVDGVHYDKAKELIAESVNSVFDDLDKTADEKDFLKVFKNQGSTIFEAAATYLFNTVVPEELQHHFGHSSPSKPYLLKSLAAVKGTNRFIISWSIAFSLPECMESCVLVNHS